MKLFRVFTKDRAPFVLIGIFFMASLLRMVFLADIPNGFHRDEVISGYVGRYIFQNGVDIYGTPWPVLYVDKYGDYPPVLPMYLSGIGTYFFGNTVFATRLPVALVGSLFVLPMYLLAASLFRNRSVGLLAALGAAVTPWHIVLSRATAEGIVALTVAAVGLWLLITSARQGRYAKFAIAIGLLLLTYLLYPSFRLLVPLMLLPLPFLVKRSKIPLLLTIGAIAVSIVLTGSIAASDWGRGRFEQTSIFGPHRHPPISEKIDHFIKDEGPGNVMSARIFHNKLVMYSREVVVNYATYFSPMYLFLQGGYPYRYHIPDQGLIPLTFVVFLIAAVYALQPFKEKRFVIYMWYLLLVTPLPAALTFDDAPNIHRSLFMVLPLILLAAFGAYSLFAMVKARGRVLLAVSLAGMVAVELIYFFHQYMVHTVRYENRARASGNVETMQEVLKRRDSYDRVVMPVHDAFPIYYLYFAGNYDPSIAGKFGTFLRFDHADTVYFVDANCPVGPYEAGQHVLIIESVECPVREGLPIVAEIKRSDTSPLYRFIEKK